MRSGGVESMGSGSRKNSRFTAVIVLVALTIVAAVAILPAATGDTVADAVLGQPDFVHEVSNTVNGSGLNTPDFIAVDRSTTPNHLYVADSGNNRVLGWNDAAGFATDAPADLVIGQPDFYSNRSNFTSSGRAAANDLSNPLGVAVDKHGNLFVADAANNRVLEYGSPFSSCASLPCAGLSAKTVFGQLGDFTASGCNLGNSTIAPGPDSLCGPNGIAIDSNDNLYIADFSNNRVLEYITPLTPSSTAGSGDTTADLVFGQGTSGTAFTTNANSPVSTTNLNGPRGVVTDTSNNVYIADSANNRVLEYNESANPPTNVIANEVFGTAGSFTAGGTCGSAATDICAPYELALDAGNNLYVADRSDERVLEFSTPASNTTANLSVGHALDSACSSGPVTASDLCQPQGAAVDSAGDLFVSDTIDNRIVRFTAPLATGMAAGTVLGQANFSHTTANSVAASGMSGPLAAAVDQSSSPNRLYVADTSNNRVLGWRNATSFANGSPADLVIGQVDFSTNTAPSPPTASTLAGPRAVAVDAAGNLYVADTGNNRLLEYASPFAACNGTFPCIGAAASLVLGQTGFTASIAASPPNAASLSFPDGVALDSLGNLYIADRNNNRVLEYNSPIAIGMNAGLVFGQGGSFTAATANTGGISAASLDAPRGVAVDSLNNLYVADSTNNRVLEFTENSNPPVNVSADVVFGQAGSFTSGACAGSTSATSLCAPSAVAIDPGDNVYVVDSSVSRVLEYNQPLSTDTTADRVFGQADNMTTAFCNFNNTNAPGPGTLCSPVGVAADSSGDLFIADSGNNRVLRFDQPLVTPTPSPSPSATPTQSPSPTPSATPTATPTGTPTATPTGTPSRTPTPTPSPTPTPIAKLSAAPATLQFGSETASVASKAKPVTLTNAGKVPANIGQLAIAANSDFVIANDLCSGKAVAPKKKCTLGVQFAPLALDGSVTRTLTIPYNGNGPLGVALEGTAVAVTLAAPKTETFPVTVPGKASKALKVTIINPTAATVMLKSANPFGTDNFAIVTGSDTCSGAVLAKAKKCSVAVEFTPGPLTSAGSVPDDSLSYDFTYGSPAINGNVAVTLKGKAK